jgi:hypothetical protein
MSRLFEEFIAVERQRFNWNCFHNIRFFICLWLCVFCCSCASRRFEAIDLSQPGWKVQQGEATWKPGKKHSEFTGEIVVASREDGRSFVQFATVAFPIVTAQCAASHWQIEFPSRKLRFGGAGKPSSRFGWLQLSQALRHERLAEQWHFEQGSDGRWRLENRESGECLEGILFP